MTDEQTGDQIEELSEDELALENMENTLKEMHGDESYDDLDDEPVEHETTNEADDEPEKEQNEETQGEQETEDSDATGEPEEDSEASEAGAEEEDEQTGVNDDRLMEGMKEETAKRFQHFRDENERLETMVNDQQADYNELHESTKAISFYLEDSQINPEQLSASLSFAKAINTGDFEAAREAFPRMKQMMNYVAVGLGDPSAQVELPDNLKQARENLEISPELAQQQAVMQHQQQIQHQHQQQAQQQQQRAQQEQQTAQQAVSAIRQWETEAAQNDPDFLSKKQQLKKHSHAIMTGMHPSQWLPAIEQQYGLISETYSTLAEQRQREMAKNQGIRPGSGSGAATAAAYEPSSMDDLIKHDLARMRGTG